MKWSKLGWNGPNWDEMVQTGMKWSKLGLNGPDCDEMVQTWTKWSNSRLRSGSWKKCSIMSSGKKALRWTSKAYAHSTSWPRGGLITMYLLVTNLHQCQHVNTCICWSQTYISVNTCICSSQTYISVNTCTCWSQTYISVNTCICWSQTYISVNTCICWSQTYISVNTRIVGQRPTSV